MKAIIKSKRIAGQNDVTVNGLSVANNKYLLMFVLCIFCVLNSINCQELIIVEGTGGAPDLIIIPVQAQDTGAAQSKSRFILFEKDNNILAKGVQDISLQIINLNRGEMGMVGNHWGLGGEHSFLMDYPNWGNGLFSADIITDPKFPLTLKVCDAGYAYLCGRGAFKLVGGPEYKFGYNVAEEAWIAGILSKHQLVREGSCEAAGRLGLTSAVPNLMKALGDPVWEVRRNACEALGLLVDSKNDEAVRLIEQAVNDNEVNVSEAASKALEHIKNNVPGDSRESGFMYRTNFEPNN